MKRRIGTFICLMAACATMAVMPASVKAANTGDTSYTVNVNSSGGVFKSILQRDKRDNTKVYVYITTSPYQYIQVQTWGDRNSSNEYNETVGTTATVQNGVKSSITNKIYENRKPNNTYVLARIKLRSGSSATGTVSGVWSPDSSRNYTVVN